MLNGSLNTVSPPEIRILVCKKIHAQDFFQNCENYRKILLTALLDIQQQDVCCSLQF